MESFLRQLKKIPLGEMICFHQRIPARPSRWGRPKVPFPESIQKALTDKGITRLYAHQVEALEKIQTGEILEGSVILTILKWAKGPSLFMTAIPAA